jgi:DoxX-like family
MTWTGRILSALAIAFMLFDSIGHLLMPAPVAQAFATLGFPTSTAFGIGLVELALVALYAIPRTSIIGAILLTGYLGGAVAAKVRVAAAPFDTLFPFIIAAMIWGGVFLRDARVRAIWARP